MQLNLSDIQTVLEELKDDSAAIKDAGTRAKVEQLCETLNHLELEQTLAIPDGNGKPMPSLDMLEQLASLAPLVPKTVSHKEPLLSLLLQLAIAYRSMGEVERTVAFCEQILELTSDGKFPHIRGEAFRQLGNIEFYKGQWAKAQNHLQQSLTLFETIADPGYAASVHNNLGYIAVEQGNYELAKTHHQQAIDIGQRHKGMERLIAGASSSLGIIASIQADWDTALDCFEKSITIYEDMDLPAQATGVYINLAMAYVDAEEWEAAGECYAKAMALAEKSGNFLTLSKIYVNRAELLINMSNFEIGRLYCNKALAIFEKVGDTIGIAEVYKLFGRIHRHQKAWDAAIKDFTRSLNYYQSCQSPQGEAEGCYEFGLLHKELSDTSQAHYYLRRSLSLYQLLDAKEEIERVNSALQSLTAKTDGCQGETYV